MNMITINTQITISKYPDGTTYILNIPQSQKDTWIIVLTSLFYQKLEGYEIRDGDTTITFTRNDDVPNEDKGYIGVEHIDNQINVQLTWLTIASSIEQLLDNYWHDECFYVSMRYSSRDNDFVRLTMLDQEDDSIQETLHHIYSAFLLNIKGVSYQNIEEIEASVTDRDNYDELKDITCSNQDDWHRFVAEFLKDHFELGKMYFRSNELDGQAAINDYWAVVDVETMEEWTMAISRLAEFGLVRLVKKDLSKLYFIKSYILETENDELKFSGWIQMLERKT